MGATIVGSKAAKERMASNVRRLISGLWTAVWLWKQRR